MKKNGVQKVASSNLVAPTFFRKKPFGENVEGLSHYWAKSYVIETPVQTDDFEDSPLGGIIRRKPFTRKALRKFNRLDGDVRVFVVATVEDFGLQLGALIIRRRATETE